MSEITDRIAELGGGYYVLTEDEYWAVYDWVNAEKDRLPSPLKEGLLKLLNGEMYSPS